MESPNATRTASAGAADGSGPTEVGAGDSVVDAEVDVADGDSLDAHAVMITLVAIRITAAARTRAPRGRLTSRISATSMVGAIRRDRRPFAQVLIAETDAGESAGFALFFHNFSTWEGKPGIWLEDLFVRPTFRGAGFGKALLAELARLAVERGCARLEWSVLDWNEPSIEFYKALGARPMDEWTTYRMTGEALRTLATG
jgi:GNAT superfamily N-acetyltransferase